MVEKPVRLLTLDECSRCLGLWFDGGEFDRGLKIMMGLYGGGFSQSSVLGAEGKKVQVADPLPCPVCGPGMQRYMIDRAGIEIDSCGNCGGLWLDGGELGPLRSLAEQDRPKISDEAIREIKSRPVGSIGVEMVGDFIEAAVTPRRHRRGYGMWEGGATGGLVGMMFDILRED